MISIHSAYRQSSLAISEIKEKENLVNIIISNEKQKTTIKEILDKIIGEDDQVIQDIILLFSKLNIYKYNYKEDSRIKYGVIIQEIQQIIPHNKFLLDFLIEEEEEAEIDENGNSTGTLIKEYTLRGDNLETLKTIFMVYLRNKLNKIKKSIEGNIEKINTIAT